MLQFAFVVVVKNNVVASKLLKRVIDQAMNSSNLAVIAGFRIDKRGESFRAMAVIAEIKIAIRAHRLIFDPHQLATVVATEDVRIVCVTAIDRIQQAGR